MPDHQTLNFQAAIGRYGVAYVRKVCAQAHVGFTETTTGEDVLAIDAVVEFEPSPTRVQIKGTTHYSLTKQQGTISFAIEQKWRDKWRRNQNPAYFILVLMEADVDMWFKYGGQNTLAGAYALWARIDNVSEDATHLYLDRSDRFTTATLVAWNDDLYAGYGDDGDGV